MIIFIFLYFFRRKLNFLRQKLAILKAAATKRGGAWGAQAPPKQTNKQESVCADKLQAPAYPFLITDKISCNLNSHVQLPDPPLPILCKYVHTCFNKLILQIFRLV